MAVTTKILGLEKFDGGVFSEKVDHIIAHANRRLTFVFRDGSEVGSEWKKRKAIPYSIIGADKRVGRNICYSKCGKGNMSERRRKKLEKKQEEAYDGEK